MSGIYILKLAIDQATSAQFEVNSPTLAPSISKTHYFSPIFTKGRMLLFTTCSPFKHHFEASPSSSSPSSFLKLVMVFLCP